MKYIAIFTFNGIAIFGAAQNNEFLQYIYSKENKRCFIKMSHKYYDTKEIYTRKTFLQGPPLIEKASRFKTGLKICEKIIHSAGLHEEADHSLFEELKQQYDYYFNKQINAHKLAFLALNMIPAPFITEEKESLRRITLDTQDVAITYFIFNVDGIRTKVSRDRCLQRTTDSDDEIISWSLQHHKETAQTIYTLAKKMYEKQKLEELRIYNQGHYQK